MKAKVIRDYIDKYTREYHAAGEMVTLTERRFAELTKEGRYVEEAEPDSEAGLDEAGEAQAAPETAVSAQEPGESGEVAKKTRRSGK